MRFVGVITSRKRRFFGGLWIESGCINISPLVGLRLSNAKETVDIASVVSVTKKSRWHLSPFRMFPTDLVEVRLRDGGVIVLDGTKANRIADELTLEIAARAG